MIKRHNPIRPCTGVWLLLMLLTLVTYGIGEAGLGGIEVVFLLLAMVLIKGQMVADFFMGLRRVRLRWRILLTIYLLLVVSGIALAYLMGIK